MRPCAHAHRHLERERPRREDSGRNGARLAKIREIDADLWILREAHEAIDLTKTHHGASTTPSPRKPRPGETLDVNKVSGMLSLPIGRAKACYGEKATPRLG